MRNTIKKTPIFLAWLSTEAIGPSTPSSQTTHDHHYHKSKATQAWPKAKRKPTKKRLPHMQQPLGSLQTLPNKHSPRNPRLSNIGAGRDLEQSWYLFQLLLQLLACRWCQGADMHAHMLSRWAAWWLQAVKWNKARKNFGWGVRGVCCTCIDAYPAWQWASVCSVKLQWSCEGGRAWKLRSYGGGWVREAGRVPAPLHEETNFKLAWEWDVAVWSFGSGSPSHDEHFCLEFSFSFVVCVKLDVK